MGRRKKKVYCLGEILKLLTEEQLNLASEYIENTKFMEAQLAQLRQRISEEGVDEEYQYGSKPTASMDLYLKISKQYGVNIRFLSDMIQESSKPQETDELLDFIRGRSK